MLERLGRVCVGFGFLWIVVIVGFWLMVGLDSVRGRRGEGALIQLQYTSSDDGAKTAPFVAGAPSLSP